MPLADAIAMFRGADCEADAEAAAEASPAPLSIHLRREKLLIARFYRAKKTRKPRPTTRELPATLLEASRVILRFSPQAEKAQRVSKKSLWPSVPPFVRFFALLVGGPVPEDIARDSGYVKPVATPKPAPA